MTVVDAVNGFDTLERHPEAVKQVAVADRIILSKADLCEPPQIAALVTRLDALNPLAPRALADGMTGEILFAEDGLYDPSGRVADVAAWLQAETLLNPAHDPDAHGSHHQHRHDVNRHGDDITAFCVVLDRPVQRLGLHTAGYGDSAFNYRRSG